MANALAAARHWAAKVCSHGDNTDPLGVGSRRNMKLYPASKLNPRLQSPKSDKQTNAVGRESKLGELWIPNLKLPFISSASTGQVFKPFALMNAVAHF